MNDKKRILTWSFGIIISLATIVGGTYFIMGKIFVTTSNADEVPALKDSLYKFKQSTIINFIEQRNRISDNAKETENNTTEISKTNTKLEDAIRDGAFNRVKDKDEIINEIRKYRR